MKATKLLLCSLIIVFGLSLSGCSKDSEPMVSTPEVEETQRPLNLQVYAYSLLASRDLIEEFVLEANDPAKEYFRSVGLPYDAQVELQENLLPLAKKFSADFGFTQADYEEILEVPSISQKELEAMQLTTMVFGVLLERANDHSLDLTGKRDLIDCIGRALVIKEAWDALKGFGKGAVTRATIRAALRVALKFAGKTAIRAAGGIGFALMVAEVAYCMLSDEHVVKYTDELELQTVLEDLRRAYGKKYIPPYLIENIREGLRKAREERLRQQMESDKWYNMYQTLNGLGD